jgi:hypothetical protein
MATLEIGQKGKLGNEVLTVVSFDNMTFKCDNGKMYMIATAKWMTEGIETAAPKAKKARKYNACPEGFYSDEAAKNIDFDAIQERARMNQRGSSLR